MSSNRLIYDKCAYAKEIAESTSPLDYYLFKDKYEHKVNCNLADFPTILPLDTRATVENELYGLDRLNTLCPERKYNAHSAYKNPGFTPPRLCEKIYYLTPNNMSKPTTNMLNNEFYTLNTSCSLLKDNQLCMF